MFKKVFVYTNANCRRRLLDTKKLKLYFQKNRYNLVEKPQNADLIVYVTCAYRNEVADRCLKIIQDFQRFDARLIIAGCLPEIDKDKLAEIFKGYTISTKNLNDIDKYFPDNKIKFSEIKDIDLVSKQDEVVQKECKTWKSKIKGFLYEFIIKNMLHEHLLIYLLPSNPKFYNVRISWGCAGNCSYCGIKKAIGVLKSKTIDECLKDFKKGVDYGYKNIIITADDVGAYGIDIGSSFPELLKKFLSIPGEYSISIQDFNPKWAVKYIDELEVIFKNKKIGSCHIALQSGCSKILKLMNRYSDIEKINDALQRLKKSNSNMSLDVHFILGFPSETREDFVQTTKFINDIDFDMGFIFRFSCKAGTTAEKIDPKIQQEEIVKRFNYAKKMLKENNYKVLTLTKNSFYTFYKKRFYSKYKKRYKIPKRD